VGITLSFLAAVSIAMPHVGQITAGRIVQAASSAGGTSMHLELFIAPDRRILSCRMIHVEPANAPVTRVCARLTGKKTEGRARGPDGQAVHAVFDFVFTLGRVGLYKQPPEFQIEVQELPSSKPAQLLDVALVVNADGVVSDCGAMVPESNSVADIACARLIGTQRGQRHGTSGEAVAYLDSVLVGLVKSSR
jgi:hypothetical protein